MFSGNEFKTSPVQRVPKYSQTSQKLTIAFRWGFGKHRAFVFSLMDVRLLISKTALEMELL